MKSDVSLPEPNDHHCDSLRTQPHLCIRKIEIHRSNHLNVHVVERMLQMSIKHTKTFQKNLNAVSQHAQPLQYLQFPVKNRIFPVKYLKFKKNDRTK